MQLSYDILYYLNWVFIALTSVGSIFQLFYIVFAFLKPKRFPASEKKNKIAVILCARDEESVIGSTVKALKIGQDYPKDKFDVYVVADNCSDNTAKAAEEAGAIVFIHNDPDPKTHRVAFAFKYGLAQILASHPDDYDFLIRFDADNHARYNYLTKMNDAFNAGVEIARPYEASTNASQNSWTEVSATYYMRDSRLASNFRERLGLDSMLTGAGMMVSMKILKDKGWDAMSASEDAEYTINRLCEKKRVHYVAEAVVYEDQPSATTDNWRRLTRMGHGLNGLFWKKGFKLFGHFFVSGRWSNIDLFFQLFFIPIGVICCLWFPAYYIYFIILHLINSLGPTQILSWISPSESGGQLWELCWMIFVVLGMYYFVYTFQTWLACQLSKKDLGMKNLNGYHRGIFLSAIFMVYYGVAITWGVLTNPKWKPVKRNFHFVQKHPHKFRDR